MKKEKCDCDHYKEECCEKCLPQPAYSKKETWSERFDERFSNNIVWWKECLAEMSIGDPDLKSIKDFIRQEMEAMLNDYSDWLHKKGYIDSDYYTEEPHAVDAYLESLIH